MYAALDRRLWPRDETDLYLLLGCLNCLMASAADDLGYPNASEELIRAAWAYAMAIDHHPLMAKLRLDLATVAYCAPSCRTTGADMSRFPSPAHLSSWAGLCPGNHESAGKRRMWPPRRATRGCDPP